MEHPSELRVEFCGEQYSAPGAERLTFRRSAGTDIDENRFRHRTLGECRTRHGLRWLHNLCEFQQADGVAEQTTTTAILPRTEDQFAVSTDGLA